MKIVPYEQLQEHHSFHCPAQARFWAEYDTLEELKAILKDAADFALPMMSVGQGCNLLFVKDYPGILLHSRLEEVEIAEETDDGVLLRVGSGKIWDEFVDFCVEHSWSGIENLSGIPSSVGAVPVQNIGAYGVEAKDVIEKVLVWDKEMSECIEIYNKDCLFAYRSSRFKSDWKDRYIVVYVYFRLKKNFVPKLDYGQLIEKVPQVMPDFFDCQGKEVEKLRAVRQSILEIRASKLPDPAVLGNAGSFFVNPVISVEHCGKILKDYPQMPVWRQADGSCKVPAAFLIENCGWKGKNLGNAGCYEKQPLVLVNRGGAQGEEVLALYSRIAADVMARFDILLRPEVVIVGETL